MTPADLRRMLKLEPGFGRYGRALPGDGDGDEEGQ